MRRLIIAIALAAAAVAGIAAQDFEKIDALHDDRKLDEEIATLKPLYKASDPQAAIVWRMIRAMQEKAVQMPSSKKKEKLEQFDAALSYAQSLLDSAKGNARDRAKVLYYYGVALGQKGQAMGVLNSLFMAGDIKSACDRSIAIDPTFGDPYYLKAKVDDAIPEIAGGDKTRMGQLYAKALHYDPENLYYLTDFAKALKSRNKDAKWNDGSKGVPAGRSDLDYAKEIAKRGHAAFAAMKAPSIDEREKIDQMKAAGL
ncbi:MAG: hypothetical protein Q8M76_19505 [Spirochaetaceae bacterium]|nr:hypothetical protein [Spirochaetaceae bacterium]